VSPERIRYTLSGLDLPAERWQIVAWAEHYGADAITLYELHRLPCKSYRTIGEVLDAIRG